MALQLWTRARGRYIRSASHYFSRRSLAIHTRFPLISFTFDDFPRSALLTGGAILERHGLRGTYYASFGLMGKEAPTGAIFLPQDLKVVLNRQHELGCHTFEHCDAWETTAEVFESSIVENRRALSGLVPGTLFKTLSYPINPPRVATKRRVSRYFACCRGGGQTFNAGIADLNNLSGFFLEKSRNDPDRVKDLIIHNAAARGWLIFATHDVCKSPTPYGCTPEFFEEIVGSAVDSGARVLPVCEAWEVIRASSAA